MGPGGALDAYQILLRLLHRNDWFTQEKACLLLSAVLASRPDRGSLQAPRSSSGSSGAAAADGSGASSSSPPALPADEVAKAAMTFIDWLCAQLRRPSDPTRSVPTAVHALSQLLREAPLRAMLHRAGGVQLLAPLVAMPPPGNGQLNIQLLYEATLCCWELSFHRPAADVLCGSTNVVGALADIVQLAAKEKLVRVALMALKNLIAVGPMSLEYAVVEKGLPKALANRSLQVRASGAGGWCVGCAAGAAYTIAHCSRCCAVLLRHSVPTELRPPQPTHCPPVLPVPPAPCLPCSTGTTLTSQTCWAGWRSTWQRASPRCPPLSGTRRSCWRGSCPPRPCTSRVGGLLGGWDWCGLETGV
jgi:hypothetical protein